MKIVIPKYDECITNITASIQKEFKVKRMHNSLPCIDELLAKNDYKNVIVILYDGMGANLLKRILGKDSFLVRNMRKEIHTVFPPTTTAATTSILSGLNPNEHLWLGWDIYFENIGKTISLFKNTIKDTETQAASYNVGQKELPYKTVIEQINEDSNYKAYTIASFGENPYSNLDEMNERIINLTKQDGKKFIYAYYNQPDYTTHRYRTDGLETKQMYQYIDKKTEELCNTLEDTLVIVTADHGHINSSGYTLLTDYKDFADTLERETFIEARATSFKVKKERKEEFETLFDKYFADKFILLTKEEVLKSKLFGDGKDNEKITQFIGDYMALATSDKYFRYGENSVNLASHHAGITEDEMIIPLMIIEKYKNTY